MSTPAQPVLNIENAHLRGGPRTEEGKASSCKNAITHGLFAARDFVRPGEHTLYSELAESLHAELAPTGPLELTLVDEIRRAMWRLRRCGEVEANLVIGLDNGTGYIFDPMEFTSPTAEKVQRSVDRARSLSHRLLHKCTAELRKLQSERNLRLASEAPPTAQHRDPEPIEMSAPPHPAVESSFCNEPGSFCKTPSFPQEAPPQTPRNAECPCGSGLKHKRCCGRNAPAMLHAA
jgi:hypothetical protein